MFNNSKVFIVAEIGYNHGGSLEKALRMVRELITIKDIDAIKFQIDSPDKIYSKSNDQNGYDLFKNVGLTIDENVTLFDIIQRSGKTGFFSTSDEEAIDLFINKGLPLIKLASGSIFNYKVLEKIGKHQLPAIASIGLSDLPEIVHLYNYFQSINTSLAILYCTALYPTLLENVYLGNITWLKTLFPNTIIGYSDHTRKQEIVLGAVALGARIVEMHCKLDDEKNAVEDSVSYTMSELKSIAGQIRNLEIVMDSNNDHRLALNSELVQSRGCNMRGIYLNDNLNAGEQLDLRKVIFLRPAKGIYSSDWPKVDNKKINKSKQKGEALYWEDLI